MTTTHGALTERRQATAHGKEPVMLTIHEVTPVAPMRTGAPYALGDPILVEADGVWCEGTVTQITEATNASFGLRWWLTVRLSAHELVRARCDDDGRNHTWRQQVMSSYRVVA